MRFLDGKGGKAVGVVLGGAGAGSGMGVTGIGVWLAEGAAD